MDFTVADVSKAVNLLRKNAAKPKIVKTNDEADSMNKFYKMLGLEHDWKVGDEYYEFNAHPDVVQKLRSG